MINWSTMTLQELAGFVSEELRKRDINTVLVGGACVTIYSKNRYQSYDLDYVTYEDMKKVKKALLEIGFSEKNKYFKHTDCKWFIEFVSPPVAVGNEPINQFNHISTPLGEIRLLHPTDSVKDRLASFYHWDDKQGLQQAIDVCLEQPIDFTELERWSLHEGHLEKFQLFINHLKKQEK